VARLTVQQAKQRHGNTHTHENTLSVYSPQLVASSWDDEGGGRCGAPVATQIPVTGRNPRSRGRAGARR
jgi:hypothetical protein